MKTSEQRKGGSEFSRRTFLKYSTGISFAIAFDPLGGVKAVVAQTISPSEDTTFGAWVKINTDGGILIYNPAAEMGQGTMTALPLIVAEEMDADWSDVCIEHSPIEPDIYGRSWGRGGGNTMLTVGSYAVRGYFNKLRVAGAQIRQVLLDNAARNWGVSSGELATEPSVVVHSASGRRMSYGEIAAIANVPSQLPKIDESQLRSPADFRLIGHSVPRHDVPGKTDGSAEFALDVHLPGMLYGMITRSPVHNGRPASYNEAKVRSLPGVTTTVELEHGVGIIGESIEAVIGARGELDIKWAEGNPAERFDSEAILAGYAGIADDDTVEAHSIVSEGDPQVALEQATIRYEADYFADYVYHAQMEPLNAVVSVNEAGDGAEVWVGTQATASARSTAAQVLGVDMDRIIFHPCYLGGGFGRRSNSDYLAEAVHLSNAVKRPVKLLWTRKDDLQYGMFRPMCLQRLAAGLDDQGNVTAWKHSVVGDGGRRGGLLTSGIEIPFYNIPNQHIEARTLSHGIRVKHWRSVAHGFNKFAIEAFVDEIAAGQSVDPYQFRRTLLQNSPRAQKVLDTVAEMANWGGTDEKGRAKGIAFGERSGSLAAGVAEISINESTGKIRVHRFWCALDAGIIVQPDNAQAQIEGSVVMGLSSALIERITIKDGKVRQSNFHNYPIMRMSDVPEVEVKFVASSEPPTGIGEPGLPITGGAVANAFAALTGKRLRHLPFSEERVRAVLS